jgi:pyridoxamine 5'-phosphate oxidase
MENRKTYLNQLRYDFLKQSMDESEVDKDPLIQFTNWFKAAVETAVVSPNAMVVATASKEGKPSARVLLLRNFGENGFVFYSNYNSRKAANLEDNPYAALNFFWPELEKQIRIEGVIEKHSDKESDAYFSQRPDGSKLAAWSSPQSKVISNRAYLEEKYAATELLFKNQDIPRPPFWGGYVLKPHLFEFWQGRLNRMHDRVAYKLIAPGEWKIERLAP